jgi:uncharacterized membrane protein (UPF0127 family)
MRRIVRPSLIAMALALLAGCSNTGSTQPLPSLSPFPIGRPSVFNTASGPVEISIVAYADTPETRAQGLMGRTSLPANAGMMFAFDSPTDTTFWMKDTLIPLSIAFIAPDRTIVGIMDMQPCTADPCPTYAPDTAYITAIETNQGWFADHGVKVGDHLGKPLP